MGKARLDPLNSVKFHCRACGHRFESVPDEVVDTPESDHHPFSYSSTCPECEAIAEQAAWEKNLLKAHANATGPKTPEGIAATTKNLEGHPTPKESLLSRFNAVTHGLYARTATYFPAKPGKYDRCEGCEHLATLACMDPPRACLKRHELMLRHQIAFESRDPGMLLQLRSDTQAALQGLINDMILAIAQDGGPRISEVVWYHDKDGGFHLAQYLDERGEKRQLYEPKDHPLLKHLMNFISKNDMTLGDMGMTPKAQDDHDALQGYLSKQGADQEAEDAYRQKSIASLEKLQQLINNSYQSSREPVTVDAEVIDAEEV